MAIECKAQSNAKKLVFFHYDPTYDDNKLDAVKEQYCNDDSVIMAQEGLTIDLL